MIIPYTNSLSLYVKDKENPYGKILDAFAFICPRKVYSHQELHVFSTITSATEMIEADYTIASGIFNLKFEQSQAEWTDYILQTLHTLDQKSSKGFAFNALTSYSDPEYMKEELAYCDPCKLFDFCKRNFSKNVALLHDYNLYDFTILVRK
jgi:hypothetical protein